MAFLAKQFTSLLLLLIISRLILSTRAGRQHFNQFSRNTAATTTATTTATTDSFDPKPDNYREPAFYANDVNPHGLGTSPPYTPTSFRPLNYNPEMYTTSQETQKNMYAQKNEDQTVAEKFGAYNNPFSNSKYVDKYKENKIPTTESKEQNQYYYRDNSYQSNNNQFQQQVGPSKTAKYYDPFSGSSKFGQQYNQFDQRDNYDPYGRSTTNKANEQYIEAEEEKEKKTVPENKFGYNYNPFQRANDQTETKKESNNEQYPNDEDAELDELLDEQDNKQGETSSTPSYKFTKNEQYNDWDTRQAYGQKQQEKDNKYDDSETYWNTKKDTNNEWQPAYDHQKQQRKDNNQYAMSDAELNAMLDEEDKQAEDKIESPPESPPQGMSDTRLPNNKPYYRPYNWKEHTKEFANAFSGDALTIAAQNNP